MLLHYRLATAHNAIRDPQRVDNNSQFLQQQWMTQRQCVYELFHWHNTQLISVKHMLRTLEWLSQVLESHIQLNAIDTYSCKRHLRVSHVFSCLFRQLYISQCKFHMFISLQDHHPLVQHVLLRTPDSTMYE